MIYHWATNRSDPQNLLSITLDIPLQGVSFFTLEWTMGHFDFSLLLVNLGVVVFEPVIA